MARSWTELLGDAEGPYETETARQGFVGRLRQSLSRSRRALTEQIAAMLGDFTTLDVHHRPAVILVVGVNGTGKTTTIGKLAHKLCEHGRDVTVGAADTFRAAAEEQLEVWAKRAGARFVGGERGADPAAVAYDAV